jgi:hypothetical protein
MASISAGLYPNIAHIHTVYPPKDGVSGKYALYTKDRARFLPFKFQLHWLTEYNFRVFVHPSSILCNVRSYESKWMAFMEKVETSRLFLRDCVSIL